MLVRASMAAILPILLVSLAQSQPAATRIDAVVIKPGDAVTLAAKTGKPIRSARANNDAVQISPNEQDSKLAVLRGLRPGVSRLTVVDADGTEETLAVVVDGPEPTAMAKAVRPALAKGLHDALKAEREQPARLVLAEGLIRVAPEDTLAARELVEAMNGSDNTLSADAYQAIARVIVDSPPALVTAIIPLLKDREEATRRRAAVLLLKVDPKLLP